MWEIKKNKMQAVQVGTLLVCIFLTHCVDVGRGCPECHHVGWDVVRSLIDVYGLPLTILHGVHELMIWLCFGVGGCFHVYLQSQEIE